MKNQGTWIIFALFLLIVLWQFGILSELFSVFIEKGITLEHFSNAPIGIPGADLNNVLPKWWCPDPSTRLSEYTNCVLSPTTVTDWTFNNKLQSGIGYAIVSTPSHEYKIAMTSRKIVINGNDFGECTSTVYKDSTQIDTTICKSHFPEDKSYSELDITFCNECPVYAGNTWGWNLYTLDLPSDLATLDIIPPQTIEGSEVNIDAKITNNYPYTFIGDFEATLTITTVLGTVEELKTETINLPTGETTITFTVPTNAEITVAPKITLSMNINDFTNVNIRQTSSKYETDTEKLGDIKQLSSLEVAEIIGDTVIVNTGILVIECGDNICDENIGETCSSCEVDCGTCPVTECTVDDDCKDLAEVVCDDGNLWYHAYTCIESECDIGFLSPPETCISTVEECGDGICNGPETYDDCPEDCDAPTNGNGNGNGGLPPDDEGYKIVDGECMITPFGIEYSTLAECEEALEGEPEEESFWDKYLWGIVFGGVVALLLLAGGLKKK